MLTDKKKQRRQGIKDRPWQQDHQVQKMEDESEGGSNMSVVESGGETDMKGFFSQHLIYSSYASVCLTGRGT